MDGHVRDTKVIETDVFYAMLTLKAKRRNRVRPSLLTKMDLYERGTEKDLHHLLRA